MDFLVVGCGSIGQKHLRILSSLGHNVLGCEQNIDRSKEVERKYGVAVFNNLEECMKNKYDAAFICTPTSTHVPISIEMAKRGVNLFIEKPLSHNLDNVAKLNDIVNSERIKVLVGCNQRFFPMFRRAKKLIEENKIGKVQSLKVVCGFYLPYWHPWEDYSKGYSANRSLGGGVILDDIHELDSLLWLFGDAKEVFCFTDKISDLKIDTEDIAEIFLKFESGVVAQIHLDYLQRTYRRYYEFIGEEGLIVMDYIKQTLELYSSEKNVKTVYQEDINTSMDQMFIDEINHFIQCINNEAESINDISFAEKTLEVAMACYESNGSKKVVQMK